MSGKRNRNKTTLGKVSTIALVMLMLAMAVLPLLPQEASAAKRDRDNNTELVINSDVDLDTTTISDFAVETPETGDPGVTTDDPTYTDVTEEPTLDDPIQAATIQINKLECDDDYDGDVYQLSANCGPGSAPFFVSSNSGDQQFDGSFTAPVAPGTATVAENIPDGWGQPLVFCNIYFYDGSESGYQQWDLYDGYYVQVDLSGGDYFYCDWYNVPSNYHDTDYNGTVTIYKLVCAEDYEGSSYYQDYIDYCDEQDGVEFELNGYADYQETQTVDNGYAQFDKSVPYGPFTITEHALEGFGTYAVFCGEYQDDPSEVQSYDPVQFGDESINWELEEGWNLICYWVNYPTHNTDYKGTVTIYKLVCDADYQGSDYYQDYIDYCDEQDGVEFELNGYADYQETQTVNNGYAQFDKSVPYGPFTVTEHAPAGYGTWKIFCGEYQDDPSEVSSYDPATFGDESLNWDLNDGWNLICYWVNHPSDYHDSDYDGTVTIYKLLCPADYQGGDYYQDYIDNCDEQNGIDFRLYNYVDYQDTQTVDNGYAQWDKSVPYGAFSINEEAPAGYGTWKIFCGEYQDDPSEVPSYDSVGFTSDTMNWDLAESWNLICYWINYPTHDDGTIVIHKWECSAEDMEAFPADVDEQWFYDNCTDSMNGVDFSINHDSGSSWSGTTGDDGDGTVIFDGIEPGSLSINESIPSGYGTPYVYCRWGAIYDEDGDGIAVAIDGLVPGQFADGGTLDIDEFLMSEQMSCDWFNIPSYDWDIEIYKWLCPEGFDAYNASYDDLFQYCDKVMSGIDFTLHTGDVVRDVQNTDDNGYAKFSNVQSGTYDLTEALPTGYQTPIILCSFDGHDYDEMDVQYDTMSFELYQETIVCHWFNIPSDDSSITVYKYTCPEGYDIYGEWADPKTDCTYATNGVTYSLYGDSIATLDSTTGDSYDAAVYWNGLQEGDYTVAEWVPDGTVASFVTCQWIEDLGPYYFSSFVPYSNGDYEVGNRIDLEVHHGDDVVCQWFNVPYRPEGGKLVIVKYWCDGNIYDESHCEIYSGGIDFQVGSASGEGDPVTVTTGLDGTAGLNLAPGAYWVKEVGRQWCKAESDQVNDDGDMVVYDGQTSYLTVYNCGPGKTKEPPAKKFPNTGVAPSNVQVFLVAVNTKK